jgi:hypothetical protein
MVTIAASFWVQTTTRDCSITKETSSNSWKILEARLRFAFFCSNSSYELTLIVLRASGSASHFPRAQYRRHFDTTSICSFASELCLSTNNHRWQALVESKRNPRHKSILDSTRGIFFFATPHQGLQTELNEMVDVDSGGQRSNLMMQLKADSEFLENQKEDLIRIWAGFKQKRVISFYETVKTPSVRKVNTTSHFLHSSKCYSLHVVRIRRFYKRW